MILSACDPTDTKVGSLGTDLRTSDDARGKREQSVMNAERKAVGSHQKRAFQDIDAVEPDEDQLVKTSQRGGQKAFALLVQRYQRRVFILACVW